MLFSPSFSSFFLSSEEKGGAKKVTHSLLLRSLFSTPQQLVNNIGFGAPDWSSTNSYVVGVFSKAAIRAAMRFDNEFLQQYNVTASTVGIRPLWQNIKNMFEVTYQV